MKRLLAIAFIIPIFLVSCGKSEGGKATVGTTWSTIESDAQKPETTHTGVTLEAWVAKSQDSFYINEDLGIKFAYSSDEYRGKLVADGNKILFRGSDSSGSGFIQVFTKQKGETIEEAILALVKMKGKDPSKCKVRDNGAAYAADPSSKEYIIDLANPDMPYSLEELAKIKLADETGKDEERKQSDPAWKSPLKEFAEIQIRIKRLIDTCSDYANPLGNGTSKTTPSKFIYDNKDVFLFLPGLTSPSFYQDDSIELLK